MKKMYFINSLTGNEETIEVSAFFPMAVIGHEFKMKPEMTGICVGIAIPHGGTSEYEEFRRKLNFEHFFTVYIEESRDSKIIKKQTWTSHPDQKSRILDR